MRSALFASDRPLPRPARRSAIRTIPAIGALLASTLLMGTVLAACGGASSGAAAGARGSTATSSKRSSGSSSTSHPGGPTTTTTVPPSTTTTTDQPGWTPVSTAGGSVAIDQQTITEADGHVITVFRFRKGAVHYNLHVGSIDPPVGNAVIGPDNGSAIGPAEAPILVAAFNGGFESATGAGGFEVAGTTLVPLVTGNASLVIDANGAAHVGIWGQGLPAPGEQVVSVRQNLAPLVANGQPSAQIANISAWGATLGGGSVVARSALGQDAAGNLLFAAGMQALPSDLANALIDCGVVNAMQLDINPEWVQLAYAATPGGMLTTGIPGQNRPADQYQVGWSRDFVTVLAGGPAPVGRG